MSDASNYLESAIINAIFKGVAFPTFTTLYVALHTADPADTGTNEMTLGAWPAYARQDAAKGGALTAGWIAEANGLTKNALQLLYPVHNGASDITVTHFSVWDSLTGGNMISKGVLSASRTISPGDIYVVDVQKITAQAL